MICETDYIDFQENARFMGRFDLSCTSKPVAGWTNSAIFLSFKGTNISMRAESDNGTAYVSIILDGICRNWIQIKQGVNDYVLETNLQDEIHTLEIHKRTDILYGAISFHNFSIDNGGTFLSKPFSKDRKIEYFGDSITCGCGNLHPHELRDAPQLDDGYMSYVGISARLLEADYHTISISGIGVYQDAMGGINGLPCHFKGTLGRDSTPWDFSLYTPQVVVINLGQNDFSNPIDESKYVEAYCGFINDIINQYGNPFIFCCVGTMNNNYLPAVQTVIANMVDKGFKQIYLADLGLILPEVEGWGGGYHPSVQTHYRMGVDLANIISSKTGWAIKQRPVVATCI